MVQVAGAFGSVPEQKQEVYGPGYSISLAFLSCSVTRSVARGKRGNCTGTYADVVH